MNKKASVSRRRRRPRSQQLQLDIRTQPDDFSCGPTCLHAVYRYYGDDASLRSVIEEVEPIENGGTLAVNLACHALERGYDALIYTYNLNLFDPTWFDSPGELPEKLHQQAQVKSDRKLRAASQAYAKYFELGGTLRYEELSSALLRRHLSKGVPLLTGLSSTYLYGCEREFEDNYDDVRGEPSGHFVVLSGYDNHHRQVLVADPLQDNPRFKRKRYPVAIPRLIAAILLGVLTYDANLLILQPRES